jgi:hypothetical protein
MARIASPRRKRAGAMCFSRAVTLFCVFQLDHAFGSERPDKSGYNLFRPTPDALLREFATDRPDRTESPFTVDAGHFQIEIDLLAYTYDRGNAPGAHETLKALSIAPINLKVGLLNNVDLQVVAQTYNIQWTHDRAANSRTSASGFGDVLLRCKTNLWGNDGGGTAFGVMPFLKLPTNQGDLGNRAVEGGIILPLAIQLPGAWDLGTMVEVDHAQDSETSDYHEELIGSVTVSHDIIGRLSGYVEVFSNLSTQREADWIATFDFGFTYELGHNVQLDAGMNVGLTEAADDLNPFVGLSVRY